MKVVDHAVSHLLLQTGYWPGGRTGLLFNGGAIRFDALAANRRALALPGS